MVSCTEYIWKEYHARLHSFILSRLGRASVTDDILQEVFMRIHSQIDTLKDCGKNQGWIYQITRDAIIDYYRAQKKTEELPPTLAGPEPKLSDKAKEDISTCLMPMIENLPAVSRTFTAPALAFARKRGGNVRRDRHSYRVQGEIGTRCISELTWPRPPVQAISSNRHTNGQQGT
jgi:hypothetical protein